MRACFAPVRASRPWWALALVALLAAPASAQWRDHRALSAALPALAQEHGTAGQSVVANTTFLVTPTCAFRSDRNSFVCAETYAGIAIQSDGAESVAPLTLRRSDGPQVALVGIPSNPKVAQMSILPGRVYDIVWGVAPPPSPRITLQRADVNEWVRVTFVYPSASFIVKRDFSGTPLPAAASLAEIDAGQGEKYFYDPLTQKITARLFVRAGRTSTTLQVVGN